MKACHRCEVQRANREAILGMALSRYQFATPEIRTLMRIVLGHAISGRTLKRLVRASGRRMRRGRPPSTPRVHIGNLSDLIELTSDSPENVLQLFEEVQVQFELTPREYIEWLKNNVRRGKCMMRKRLLCARFFPSLDSSERHCRACQGNRQRLLTEERRSPFV